ncbi:MAG: hypothetical protein Q7S75_01935 [bacterium]|nr:hypothetical protein [bacterium]
MTKPSSFPISLLLIVFVALLIPLTARAEALPDSGLTTVLEAPAPLAFPAPSPTGVEELIKINNSARNVAAAACNGFWDWITTGPNKCDQMDNSNVRAMLEGALTPTSATQPLAPTSRDVLPATQGYIRNYENSVVPSTTAIPCAPTDYNCQAKYQDRALYNVQPPASSQGDIRKYDNSLAPTSRAPGVIPQNYNAQFKTTNSDSNPEQLGGPTGNDTGLGKVGTYRFEQIANNCRLGDTGDDMNICMLNSIKTYQGSIDASDAVRVRNYIQLQSNPVQTTTAGSAPASTGNSADPNGYQLYMDACDQKYGSGSADSNTCKEPILKEMGVVGFPQTSAQAPTPVSGGIYDSQGNLIAQRAGSEADLPPTYATGWGWFDRNILRIPETKTSAPILVADEKTGGIKTIYAPVEDRPSPDSPRPYTREEENALSRITVTAEETQFTPAETTSGEATGWLKNFQDSIKDSISSGWDSLFGSGSENPTPAPSNENLDYGNLPTSPSDENVIVTPYMPSGGEIVEIPLPDYGAGDTEGYAPAEPAQPDTQEFTGTPQFGADLTDQQIQLIGNKCSDNFSFGGLGFTDCLQAEADYMRANGGLPAPDPQFLPMDGSVDDVNFVPEINNQNQYDQNTDGQTGVINAAGGDVIQVDAPASNDGWTIWNPISWPIFEEWGTEASNKPTRQFSGAVPSSGELANQSLAASAFGAFLSGKK